MKPDSPRAGISLPRRCGTAERARGASSSRGLLERAVELSDGRVRSLALLELASTLSGLFDFRRSTEIAAEAITAAEEAGERAHALLARVVYAADVGQIDPAFTLEWTLSETKAALAELELLGDAAGILQAKLSLARHLYYLGDSEACRKITLELVAGARELPFPERG
jgi:hypothetical protein